MRTTALETHNLFLPDLYEKLNGAQKQIVVTPAEHALLALMDQIKLAERSPEQFRKFAAMQRLQREVDWLHNGEEPLPESDPETVAIARAVLDWILKQ